MTYQPAKDAADVFARYKRLYEGERDLKPEMIETADRALKSGATVGQLAAWTGLTPEVFRRRARALGVERKRPPTVGKLSPAPTQPAATPRRQVTQPVAEPLAISTRVAALLPARAKELAEAAEARHPDWVEEIRQAHPDATGHRMHYLIVEAGLREGFRPPELATPERPVGSEETTT